jgi:ribulose-phosphate 3-epimerase
MSQKIRIVPAILTDDPQALKKMTELTEAFADYAQYDIMDGRFVPSRSVSCDEIAALKIKLAWEAHLMVLHPEECLEDFRQAGVQMITFHYEATPVPEEVIRRIKKLGLKAGLAINPETPIDVIKPLANELDSILFLSVNPGFYGAKFISEVLDKIVVFRKAYPEMDTGIDGGVKENNIIEIARTGVDYICVGSAIYNQPDPAGSYRRLMELVEQAMR